MLSPTEPQFELALELANRLNEAGCPTILRMKATGFSVQQPIITILHNHKMLHLADPDWNVVNKQMQMILCSITVNP